MVVDAVLARPEITGELWRPIEDTYLAILGYPSWQGSPTADYCASVSATTSSRTRPTNGWIAAYVAEEFGQMGETVLVLIDRVGDELIPRQRAAVDAPFVVTNRYEMRGAYS